MEKKKTIKGVKTNMHMVHAVVPQPIHTKLTKTTVLKIQEYFRNRPNANWMSANVGDTEFYFVEKIREKEVRIPVIKTVTKYVLKEIPKEIPVEITKEVKKVITQTIVKEVTRTRNKVIYRQTPEYLHKKREAEIARAQLKKAKLEEKIAQLEKENLELSNKHIEDVKMSELKIGEIKGNTIKMINDYLTDQIEEIKSFSSSDIIYIIRSFNNDSVAWHYYIYFSSKSNSNITLNCVCFMINTDNGIVFKDIKASNELFKYFKRYNFKYEDVKTMDLDELMNIFKTMKNIEYITILSNDKADKKYTLVNKISFEKIIKYNDDGLLTIHIHKSKPKDGKVWIDITPLVYNADIHHSGIYAGLWAENLEEAEKFANCFKDHVYNAGIYYV